MYYRYIWVRAFPFRSCHPQGHIHSYSHTIKACLPTADAIKHISLLCSSSWQYSLGFRPSASSTMTPNSKTPPEMNSLQFVCCHLTNYAKQLSWIPFPINGWNFTFKICQTGADMKMIRFFQFNFWQIFAIQPNCELPYNPLLWCSSQPLQAV